MATSIRYEFEVLLHLKESPLCVKPKDLPPKEEWMGPPPEPPRTQNKVPTDRAALLDQSTRRPVAERNLSRNGGASDAQFLGPKMNFPSGSLRGDHDRNDKTPRDPDARDRFARSKIGGDDTNDRFRDPRTNNANYRRRGDGDRDTEGWSTVKPRKSFGQDGAERFTGRMGGDRHRDDRAPRERDDLDNTKDRPRRNFDADGEDAGDMSRRNGLNRGRSELWFKDGTNTGTGTGTGTKVNDTNERISNRERIEKAKSWRERNDDANLRNDRANDRYDRRWDRDREQRPSERDPEWMDEPEEEKSHGHTEADLKKFMESMKASRGAAKTAGKAADTPGPSPAPASFFSDLPAVKSAPAVERGPDKFFEAFAQSQLTPSTPVGGDRPDAGKATTGKSSRFANLFSAQVGDPRGQTEPPTPAAGPPPPMPIAGSPATQAAQQNNAEKEAFQALLQKLHLPRQGGQQATPTPPNAGAFAQPPPPQNLPQDPIQNLAHALAQKAQLSSPDQAEHFGMDRREEPRLRSVPPVGPEILAPQPMPPPSQPHSARPDQVLQDLLSQRHTAQSQGSGRIEHNSKASRDFLMQLMQSGRHAPDPPRIEQIMRMPQPQRQASIPQFHEREPDFVQQRGPVQQRQMRPPGPPGFVEEQFRHAEGDIRPMHPTQILQRPPGLDHAMQQQPPQPFMQPGQQVHPGPRPMIPPPGLMGNPPRNVPMPAMFNPSIPPGVFPPDNLPGPPRNMQPPPGFFGGGPIPPPVIPGHLPPPGMMGGFPGPEAMGFPGPFVDARGGMPPPGVGPYRR